MASVGESTSNEHLNNSAIRTTCFMRPGVWIFPHETHNCIGFQTEKLVTSDVATFDAHLEKMVGKISSIIETESSKIFRSPNENTTGKLISIKEDNKDPYFLVANIRFSQYDNHLKAQIEAVKLVKNSIHMSVDEIILELKKIHAQIFEGLDLKDAGIFRSGDEFIFSCKTEAEQKEFYGSPSYVKAQKKGADSLNDNEREKLKRFGVFAISHKRITPLMAAWALGLKKQNGKSPNEFAAQVHSQLVKIHPFSDGNGRLARIMMNAVLIANEKAPIVFLNEDEYDNAVRKDEIEPGTFSSYLNEVAIPTNERFKPVLEQTSSAVSFILRLEGKR